MPSLFNPRLAAAKTAWITDKLKHLLLPEFFTRYSSASNLAIQLNHCASASVAAIANPQQPLRVLCIACGLFAPGAYGIRQLLNRVGFATRYVC